MSDAKSPQDLSMDEILATIRRIIAEDERASSPASRGVAPGVPSGYTAGERREALPTASQTIDAIDVLDLTDALNEDGSVRRLAARGGPAGASEATASPPPAGMSPAEPIKTEAEPAATKPSAAEPAAAEPDKARPGADRPWPVEATAASDRAADPAPPPSAAQHTPLDNDERLVSEVAMMAAATAFGRLAAVPRTRRVPPLVAGRPLDDMVHELLRPLLRTWLDENLSDIVERLVQAEIARISGRSGTG
jgi:cell pole-organizing protein PopZ